MQDVCRLEKQRDYSLPMSSDSILKYLKIDIRKVSSIEITRFFNEKIIINESTLHIFCDASLTAMCALACL